MSETTSGPKQDRARTEDERSLADKELEGVSGGTGSGAGSWQQVQYPDDPPGTTRTVWRPSRT